MNKRLYIITGAPNVRKSSVIRALTGIRDTKSFQIQFQEGIRKTHIMATLPNELDSMGFDNGMSPQLLVEYLKNLNEAITLPNGVNGTVLMSNQNILPSNLTASELRKMWVIV